MFEQMKAMGAIAGLLKNREKITQAAARVKHARLRPACQHEEVSA